MNNLVFKTDNSFITKVLSVKEPYYIDRKNFLFIFNKEFFLSFLKLHKIRYININPQKNFFYLINDKEVFKFKNSKIILDYFLS